MKKLIDKCKAGENSDEVCSLILEIKSYKWNEK